MKSEVAPSALIAVDKTNDAAAEAADTEAAAAGSKMEVIPEEGHELLEVVTEDGQKLRLEPGEQFIPGEQYILVETTGSADEDAAVVAGEPALSIAAADQIIVPHGDVAEDGTEIAYEVVEVGEECAVADDVNAPEA